ncbi:glycosyltransferase family 4 protein [Ideonella margarita]|uniref:Glycosyltransferase family 1 protein n=1 Tax=Ideonella margarita TaxID=2984191 RepID=A0ABU9C0B1_9BURK
MNAPARFRLGVDAHTVDGLFQGSRSHLLGLYREVIPRLPEVDFVFLLANPEALRNEAEAFRAPNVQCEAMPHRNGLWRLGWQLAAAQRSHRLDLLHVQYRGPVWPAGPLACTIHDTLYETHPQFFTPGFVRMARWTARRTVRQSRLMFTVSQFSRSEIARHYDWPAERVAVTGNGVNLQRFHPAPGGEAELAALGLVPGGYLLTVGRIEPRKNHLGLLRAYALLPAAERLPLVIVGQRDAAVFEQVQAEVQRLGLDGQVRFLDRVGDQALPALLRHARAVVYPSFAEGFGMPVAEAMASGVPVVTSTGTALAEVAGDVALVADPSRPADIATQILRLLREPDLARELAARGPAQAAQFSWQASADVFVNALKAYIQRPC